MFLASGRKGLELLLLLVLSFAFFTQAFALPNSPVPISSYGVVALSQSVTFNGVSVSIHVSTTGTGLFYVEKILLVMETAAQVDIVLDSIIIDGAHVYAFNAYLAQKVTIIPSGSAMGDAIAQMSASLGPLLATDPMGNSAAFARGGDGNGLDVGFRYSSPLIGGNAVVMVLVVAPTSCTVTLTAA